MPHTIEKTVYTFAELDESAKDKARDWYREGALDYEWWDFVYDDANRIGELMGIEIDKIYFSGFSSQGDGACFEGSYSYVKGGAKVVKAYAPKDIELHRIARELQNLQRANFYKLSASVKHRGHYYHEMCTEIDVYNSPNNDVDEALKDLLRDYMRWIYRTLEREYEWLMSDEQVDELIDKYTFDENGRRAG